MEGSENIFKTKKTQVENLDHSLKEDSDFEVVKGSDIGYGPSIKRKEVSVDGVIESTESGSKEWLNEKQRNQLRVLLASLGISVMAAKGIDNFDSTYEDDLSDTNIENTDSSNIENKISEISDRIVNPEKYTDKFQEEVNAFAEAIDDVDLGSVQEYANKQVVGAEHLNRDQYVREMLEFDEWDEEDKTGVPPVVQKELRSVVSGLCAQESRFDADRESKAGAKGIFQIMPNVWEHYGGKEGEEISLKKQVEVAGKFMSDLYRQINTHLGNEALDILRIQFTDEESFQKDLLVPLVINAYNGGAKRIADAVTGYLDNVEKNDIPSGKDLYIAIANFAVDSDEGYLSGYKKDSREYAPKVYAFAERMKENIRG